VITWTNFSPGTVGDFRSAPAGRGRLWKKPSRYGYSRDGKRDKLQITFGLLTNGEGCPVAVEVFEGNTADPQTVRSLITKLRQRFALKRVVVEGTRHADQRAAAGRTPPAEGLDWITALRAPQLQQLLEAGNLQLSLFDQRDSFHNLLSDLATVAKNRLLPNTNHSAAFDLTTTPTMLQQRAFNLLGVSYRM
jgi:hypothetical protein